MADCYQENCPWRRNDTSSTWRCEHVACPNRDDGTIYYDDGTTYYTTNHTEVLKDGKDD